ncbi:hypothetical protein [Sphingobacterium thalpophilum]|uniref:hypothetical protein n=1 Tax=Sphingobacterium thalpophilum TaxID=259 RepID=UPI0024A665F0|nr:hypothetical protein [Sphingobacterium thalpophilum]
MNTDHSKKIYISPRIDVIPVELEQGIAAGSAVDNTVQESWDNSGDVEKTINW